MKTRQKYEEHQYLPQMCWENNIKRHRLTKMAL